MITERLCSPDPLCARRGPLDVNWYSPVQIRPQIEKVWQLGLGARVHNGIACGGQAVFACAKDRLLGVDLGSGKKNWSSIGEFNHGGSGHLTYVDSERFVATDFDSGYVFLIDAATGESRQKLWYVVSIVGEDQGGFLLNGIGREDATESGAFWVSLDDLQTLEPRDKLFKSRGINRSMPLPSGWAFPADEGFEHSNLKIISRKNGKKTFQIKAEGFSTDDVSGPALYVGACAHGKWVVAAQGHSGNAAFEGKIGLVDGEKGVVRWEQPTVGYTRAYIDPDEQVVVAKSYGHIDLQRPRWIHRIVCYSMDDGKIRWEAEADGDSDMIDWIYGTKGIVWAGEMQSSHITNDGGGCIVGRCIKTGEIVSRTQVLLEAGYRVICADGKLIVWKGAKLTAFC